MFVDVMNCIRMIVSIYVIGLLFLFFSFSIGWRLCFRFMFCECRMLNMEVEFVEDMVVVSSMVVIRDMVMLIFENLEI